MKNIIIAFYILDELEIVVRLQTPGNGGAVRFRGSQEDALSGLLRIFCNREVAKDAG